jgi:2-polyprenyl-6-methoxyphenol hydroxylase-like FAD-dependent oxidoreductase
MLFFDRREFLKVLYEQIQYRDRIHLEKRVQRIEQSSEGVTVYTQDGTIYQGDVLIGADGIHSKVRAEMKRLADISVPAYFPPGEDDKVPCYFKCSYGIAQHVSGWLEGEQGFTVGDGKSFLVVSGPAQRLYWFLFVKLPATKRGKDIPKYTSKDEIAFVEEHRDLKIKENLTFGQVYAKKLSSVLTPLHEMVYEKWFFERILLIGDSAHKVRKRLLLFVIFVC